MAADSPTAFISYCREDEKFVLRLAQGLKKAGAAVWIDQLDILPGANWDDSITGALTDCTLILVVLSPDAVKSNNVLDEVRFTLEKGKKVIPVLYRDCEVPRCLIRIQHTDFRKDYGRGRKRLLRALGVKEPVPASRAVSGGSELIVERIADYATAEKRVDDALTMLEDRLPSDELYDRKKMENLVRDHLPSRSDSSFEMYFLTATYGKRCLGMLMGWEDVQTNFFFISYMAASEWQSRTPGDVSRQIATGLLKARRERGLTTEPRFLFEIDDPSLGGDKEQRQCGLSRLRLFDRLDPLDYIGLRVLDLPYLQPKLEWPRTTPEKQLLLCYAAPGPDEWLPKGQAVEILTWVYTQLYEGRVFEDLNVRAAYQAHNRDLLDSIVRRLPERVPLLEYRDIEKRCAGA